MKHVNTIQVGANDSMPFLMKEGQIFKYKSLGYINQKNPSGDAVPYTINLLEIKVTQVGILENGLLSCIVENKHNFPINVEIFENPTK